MNDVRITLLVENTVRAPGLLAEHGLSYWIEYGRRRILFDSGQGGVIASNAKKLGVTLADAEAFVLSHGHYDHSGGAEVALRNCRPLSVYAHPSAFDDKFIRKQDGGARPIKMPNPSQKAISDSSHRFIPTLARTEIFDGLFATGPVPRLTDFEDVGGPFFLDEACTRPDPIEDDQSLFFDTPQGIVLLLGCAHSGVINTLNYVRRLTNDRPIHAIIGGMHLGEASIHRLERTLEEFRRLDAEKLVPAHCTGMKAVAAMWNAFPDRCEACSVGSQFNFERSETD